jgi:hypothetical protein
MAQTMYTHVSKCKSDKRKKERSYLKEKQQQKTKQKKE